MAAIVIRFVGPETSKNAPFGRRENDHADIGRSLDQLSRWSGNFFAFTMVLLS
jgi:hypothetical protein